MPYSERFTGEGLFCERARAHTVINTHGGCDARSRSVCVIVCVSLSVPVTASTQNCDQKLVINIKQLGEISALVRVCVCLPQPACVCELRLNRFNCCADWIFVRPTPHPPCSLEQPKIKSDSCTQLQTRERVHRVGGVSGLEAGYHGVVICCQW